MSAKSSKQPKSGFKKWSAKTRIMNWNCNSLNEIFTMFISDLIVLCCLISIWGNIFTAKHGDIPLRKPMRFKIIFFRSQNLITFERKNNELKRKPSSWYNHIRSRTHPMRTSYPSEWKTLASSDLQMHHNFNSKVFPDHVERRELGHRRRGSRTERDAFSSTRSGELTTSTRLNNNNGTHKCTHPKHDSFTVVVSATKIRSVLNFSPEFSVESWKTRIFCITKQTERGSWNSKPLVDGKNVKWLTELIENTWFQHTFWASV